MDRANINGAELDYEVSGNGEAVICIHGAIVADNGPAWMLHGVPDDRWNNQDLLSLHAVKGSDFEAVDSSSMHNPGSMAVRG